MDSNSLRGIRLASDDRMLPGSLRGYAPVVRGWPEVTPVVTVRQNGNIIYETTVPAGPFSISDLYPSGYGGDLTVTVTESDGQTRVLSCRLLRLHNWFARGSVAGRWQPGGIVTVTGHSAIPYSGDPAVRADK